MIIKEVLLDGFGCFNKKTVKFDKGLNLVIAPNESGKTSVRKSIEAALYGFINTESKRKNYYEDFYNYKSGNYRVKLNLFDGNKLISIERNLLNEEAKVYLDEEDCTQSFTRVNKILSPGIDLLGVGSSVYKEFFDIDSNTPIKNEIVNITINSTSNSDFLDLVLEIAEKERVEIGSLSAPTKKRAITLARIEKLKDKIRTYDQIELEIQNLKSLIKDIKNNAMDRKSTSIETAIIFVGIILLFQRTDKPILYIFPIILIILSVYSMLKKRRIYKATMKDKEENIRNREYYEGQLKILQEYLDRKIEDLDNLEYLKSNLKKMDYEYKLISDSISVIQDAQKEHLNYPKKNIISKSTDTFKKITNNDELMLDKDLKAYLNRGFRLSECQMSRSTKEISNFSLKMSARLSISNSDFILLDDAFQYLDEERLKNTMKFLLEISNLGMQIIIFTSNFRIKNVLDGLSVNYYEVNL